MVWEGAGQKVASKGLVFRWLERKKRKPWPVSDVGASGEFWGMIPPSPTIFFEPTSKEKLYGI